MTTIINNDNIASGPYNLNNPPQIDPNIVDDIDHFLLLVIIILHRNTDECIRRKMSRDWASSFNRLISLPDNYKMNDIWNLPFPNLVRTYYLLYLQDIYRVMDTELNNDDYNMFMCLIHLIIDYFTEQKPILSSLVSQYYHNITLNIDISLLISYKPDTKVSSLHHESTQTSPLLNKDSRGFPCARVTHEQTFDQDKNYGLTELWSVLRSSYRNSPLYNSRDSLYYESKLSMNQIRSSIIHIFTQHIDYYSPLSKDCNHPGSSPLTPLNKNKNNRSDVSSPSSQLPTYPCIESTSKLAPSHLDGLSTVLGLHLSCVGPYSYGYNSYSENVSLYTIPNLLILHNPFYINRIDPITTKTPLQNSVSSLHCQEYKDTLWLLLQHGSYINDYIGQTTLTGQPQPSGCNLNILRRISPLFSLIKRLEHYKTDHTMGYDTFYSNRVLPSPSSSSLSSSSSSPSSSSNDILLLQIVTLFFDSCSNTDHAIQYILTTYMKEQDIVFNIYTIGIMLKYLQSLME